MDLHYLTVILLGIVEGLTEFLPVSSTGHILLAGYFLGFDSPGKTFEVLIQLGAILAILSVYAAKIIRLLIDLPSDARTRRFVLGVLIIIPIGEPECHTPTSRWPRVRTITGAFCPPRVR